MKKFTLITNLIIVFSVFTSFAQTKIDTIIKTPIYCSYFNCGLKEPLYVKYEFFDGGGTCSRKTLRFKNDVKNLNAAKQKDYAHSGYDEGHLADAEDFASDCINEEITFRFYNCLPQTPNLNRGIWKKWETITRTQSKHDSLVVYCGGSKFDRKIGKDSIGVPRFCWKVIFIKHTNTLYKCLWFTNEQDNNSVEEITIDELKKRLEYDVYFDCNSCNNISGM